MSVEWTEWLYLDATAFAVVFLSVVLGALIQGSIGFGLNLVVAPVVVIFEPAALPASLLVMSIPMTLGSAVREYRHIDSFGAAWVTVGRLPGVALGAWVVHATSSDQLAQVIGALLIVASLMSVVTTRVEVRPRSALAAGFASGAMSTASSIGGPPVALLYRDQSGPVVRSTLGATFSVGILLSLTALALAGQVASWHVWLGVALMPAIALGLYASRWLHPRLDGGWLRPAVLAFSLLAGLGVLLRGWTGT